MKCSQSRDIERDGRKCTAALWLVMLFAKILTEPATRAT